VASRYGRANGRLSHQQNCPPRERWVTTFVNFSNNFFLKNIVINKIKNKKISSVPNSITTKQIFNKQLIIPVRRKMIHAKKIVTNFLQKLAWHIMVAS
jgi:hypothetical protein